MDMEDFAAAEKLLGEDRTEEAINVLNEYIAFASSPSDKAYYLLGNAYRKKGDWQGAINNYLMAMELNPESPAVNAYKMANEILDFYNKDMYNQ